MNRIDRVSAILIQLQSRKIVKAQQIADRFRISLRTVYRDIRCLEEAGIPLSGEAGVGFSLMEGYRLPPVMFTREEAVAFLTAEKLVAKMTDDTNVRHYQSAMFKIRSVLRSSEKDLLDKIDPQIEVLRARHRDQPDGLYMEPILAAIAANRILKIDYFSHYRGQSSHRQVEPVGIFHLEHYWHLIGYCHLRNDYRDFRFDRISNLQLTDLHFSKKHPSLKEYIEKRFDGRPLFPVIISVDNSAISCIQQQKYYMGFVSEEIKGTTTEMHFLTASLEGFARWFILMADAARIIEPRELHNKVRTIISRISEKLENS